MPKKPKARRGPVVKTDWVVSETIGRTNQVTLTYTAETKAELRQMLARMPRGLTSVIERKWRKIQ